MATPRRNDQRGISRAGRYAERMFCEITGAQLASRRSDGDALVNGELVEIKQTSGRYLNLNQVRAYKYLPLVVYSADVGEWYVIPAHEVVAVVSTRKAQHCLNPFECARLTLDARFRHCRVADARRDLRARTVRAIKASARLPELKEAMETVRRTALESADQARVAVIEVVNEGKAKV